MKILFANKFFFHNGGSETVFFQERDYLLNHGHEVVDFSMEHPRNYASKYSDHFVPNVDYQSRNHAGTLSNLQRSFRSAWEFVHSREALVRLKGLIRREKPEIAHLHNIYHQLTPSIIPILKNAGVKVVMTLHDYKLICPSYLMINRDVVCGACRGRHFWHATLRRCSGGSTLRSLLLSIEAYWHQWARSFDFVDRFLCPSGFLADLLRKADTRNQRVQVLRNGIGLSEFMPSKTDRSYAVYFGRLSREKGIETLLKAYDLMLGESGEVSAVNRRLKILGTGPLLEGLRRAYPHVEFLGCRTGDELRRLVSDCSFVIVPSQWYENCSMSVLESMAYGKPVIASRIGGLPEQVEDGRTGLLFQPGDARELSRKMLLLTRDRDLRERMGGAARAKLEKEYDLESHCTSLVSIYESLLSAG